MCASLRFKAPSFYDIYSFSLTAAVPDRLILTSEDIEWKHDRKERPFKGQLQSDFNESALVKSSEKTEKIIRNLLGSCKVYQFSDSSISSPMRQASTVDSAHYLQSEANNLASLPLLPEEQLSGFFPEDIRNMSGTLCHSSMNSILKPERGYISLKWMDNSANDYVLSADQFSDGSIRFIALATLLLQPEETMPFVIIVDEPELENHTLTPSIN